MRVAGVPGRQQRILHACACMLSCVRVQCVHDSCSAAQQCTGAARALLAQVCILACNAWIWPAHDGRSWLLRVVQGRRGETYGQQLASALESSLLAGEPHAWHAGQLSALAYVMKHMCGMHACMHALCMHALPTHCPCLQQHARMRGWCPLHPQPWPGMHAAGPPSSCAFWVVPWRLWAACNVCHSHRKTRPLHDSCA